MERKNQKTIHAARENKHVSNSNSAGVFLSTFISSYFLISSTSTSKLGSVCRGVPFQGYLSATCTSRYHPPYVTEPRPTGARVCPLVTYTVRGWTTCAIITTDRFNPLRPASRLPPGARTPTSTPIHLPRILDHPLFPRHPSVPTVLCRLPPAGLCRMHLPEDVIARRQQRVRMRNNFFTG